MPSFPDIVYEVLRSHTPAPSWNSHVFPTRDTNEGHFLRATQSGLRRMIATYLADGFPDTFMGGGTFDIEGWEEPIDGYLMEGEVQSLVEIVPVSTEEYAAQYRTILPRAAALAGAKARITGAEEAIVILYDRNESAWSAFRVEADYDLLATRLSSILAGDLPPTRVRPSMVTTVLDQFIASSERRRKESAAHAGKVPAIHPSEITTSTCDRRIAYSLHGTEKRETHQPHVQRIFDTGHAFHDVIQGALKEAYGDRILLEEPFQNEGLRMRGRCDAKLGNEGFEIKSINRKGYDKLIKPKPDHEKQGVLYAANMGLTSVHYFYANKETGALQSFQVAQDRKIWQTLAARAQRIVNAVASNVMPDRITTEYVCRECPYKWVCRPGGFR